MLILISCYLNGFSLSFGFPKISSYAQPWLLALLKVDALVSIILQVKLKHIDRLPDFLYFWCFFKSNAIFWNEWIPQVYVLFCPSLEPDPWKFLLHLELCRVVLSSPIEISETHLKYIHCWTNSIYPCSKWWVLSLAGKNWYPIMASYATDMSLSPLGTSETFVLVFKGPKFIGVTF